MEEFVDAGDARPLERDSTITEASQVAQDGELEKHHRASRLAELFVANYCDDLWQRAEAQARKRGDGIITRSDIQHAADELASGKPPSSWHSWMGIIGGAVFSAGLSVFLAESRSLNRVMVASLCVLLFGLLLVLVFRPKS